MRIMKKTLREYLADYAAAHRHPGTRATHLIGIPMILASLPMLPFNPVAAIALFGGGWVFQLLGHYLFERNSPAFTGDAFNLVVGPIWLAIEVLEMLGVRLPLGLSGADDRAESTDGVGRANAAAA